MLSLDLQGERRDDDEIDLLAYWRILVKRRWLVLSILAGVVALALLATLMATPIYRATTVLQLEKEGTQVVQVEGIQPGGEGWDPDFLQTQYELLRSRSLAERVADEMNLDQAAIDRLNQPGFVGRMLALLRPQSKKDARKAAAQAPASATALRGAAGVISGGLSVEPVRNSRLVRLNFDSPSPEFSARAVNAVAEGFIASGLERRFGASSYAKTYLEDQLKLTKSKLEQSERQLVAFAQKENIVNTGEGGQSLATQNLTQLNAALATAQDQRIRAQARWRQASSGAMSADMIGNSNIRVLQQQKGELQSQYQLKLQTFKPDYPEMQQLKSQIDELDRQIVKETAGVRASVRAEYDAAAAQEQMLTQQIAALRTQALDVDGPVYAFELWLEAIPEPKKKAVKTKPALTLSPFMPLSRDFAFVVDRATAAGEVVRAVQSADRVLIAGVRVFDVYEGPGVPEGKKSVAIEAQIQPREKTLTDAEIEALSAKIIAAAAKSAGAVLRG